MKASQRHRLMRLGVSGAHPGVEVMEALSGGVRAVGVWGGYLCGRAREILGMEGYLASVVDGADGHRQTLHWAWSVAVEEVQGT